MNCLDAREVLPEHALGVAGERSRSIEEHLAWCAACRREAADLQGAAAALAFVPAPVDLPDDLEDVVFTRIHAAAGRRGPVVPRGRRTLVVAAATVAVAVLGTGVVLANKPARIDPVVRASQQTDAFVDFQALIEGSEFADEQTRASIGVLMPSDGRPGSGSAMSIVGPTIEDRAMVVVSGLPSRPGTLPYAVWLADADGDFFFLGEAAVLDSGGGFTVARIAGTDLRGFVNVIVRDRSGRVALRGTLDDEAPVPSPGS